MSASGPHPARGTPAEPTDSVDRAGMDMVMELLRTSRGIDFSGYKRSTLIRRIQRRMAAVGAATLADYGDFLEVEPDEYVRLLDSLLINVTGFFRDRPAWQALTDKVVPRLLADKPEDAPVRVWSAGCATGEEAYSLAMVLADAMGVDKFRQRVKIYATDVDEEALQDARSGVYSERRVQDVPAGLRERFFEPVNSAYAFRRDLRRQVIFGRNDLTRDAPISQVDLLAVRNTLMYFNAETQAATLRRLHFALADGGYIFLGKAEMLVHNGSLFEPVDLRKRLFKKVSTRRSRTRRLGDPMIAETAMRLSAVRAAALAAGPIAQLAVDVDENLQLANTRAQILFGLSPSDIGRPFQDLEVSYQPVELRSLLRQVRETLRPAEARDTRWQREGDQKPMILDVSVLPLFDHMANLVGFGVNFADVTGTARLREELEHANEELERAYQDVQSLNEELETTNEELQSTNEELETTNEELQSTNEELETMNEELQSTNDELQDINDALRGRTEELDRTNSFLASVLESLGHAVIVVDGDLRVTVWSQGAMDLWGLRDDEANGRHLLALDIGLPTADLVPALQEILRADERAHRDTFVVDAINRRGRRLRLRVDALPLREGVLTNGVIIVATQADPAEAPPGRVPPAGDGRDPVRDDDAPAG
ncbi:MAG TPA: CheR family methyltransferase [Streptosporangiaceae bacterium]